MLSYFQPLIEQYYFINIIPDIVLFGFPGHFYFYLFVLLGLGVFLIFVGIFMMRSPLSSRTPLSSLAKQGVTKKGMTKKELLLSLRNIFFSMLLILWFVASLPWFITQIHWLINDIDNFYGKSIRERQRIAVANVIKNYGLGEDWHDFYDFLEFGKNKVPKGSSIYIVPDNPVFGNFAHYYLYPDARVITTSQTADYIFSFNVTLPDELIDFETIQQLGLNKVILKQKQK
ncbi:hypothetical protein MYX06_03600 [Patescibacteria group bacterium AH-259-L05]|nr:hypothetical protein [Patescibacteria group bacterium AH-259-L05]